MKNKLTVIQGGDAKSKLQAKLVKEAIRVCVDRDSTGNVDAMLKKLRKMKATNKPKLGLVVALPSTTSEQSGH